MDKRPYFTDYGWAFANYHHTVVTALIVFCTLFEAKTHSVYTQNPLSTILKYT